MNTLLKYWRVWLLTGQNRLQEAFVNRWSNLIFFLGKALRLSMSLVFLFLLKERQVTLAGYTTDQVIVFFLTYQIMDIVAQVFYRGVYMFGSQIRSGEFDFLLCKPLNPLFRALTGQPDVDDSFFLIPTLRVSFYLLTNLDVTITTTSLLWYLLLLLNSFLIATAFHILVLVVGILTVEVDSVIFAYRDISRLAQFPVTLYIEPFRTLLFFLVPVGFMITIPSQVLLNVPPTYSLVITTLTGIIFFFLSLRIWAWGLKHYTSASS